MSCWKRGILALAIHAGGTATALAEPGQVPQRLFMTDSQISAAFGGRTIDGAYADATPFTETYHADGRITYLETGRNMSGRWLVQEGTFCTLYETSPTGGCYRVVRKGSNCFEFYFVARDDAQVRRGDSTRPSWTAQGWIKDRPSSCREEPAV